MTRASQNRKSNRIDTAAGRWSLNASFSGLTLFLSLLACMLLWPSEGAMQGDGLHLSLLWLVALCAVMARQWLVSARDTPDADSELSGTAATENISWLQPHNVLIAGVVIFVAGVWVSTWHVFAVGGDRRSALNLAFEWTAIGACGLLCRQLFVLPGCRRTTLNLLAGLGVGLAVFGMWKSQIFYANEAQAYSTKREVLDTQSQSLQAAKIRQEFARNGIPLEGAARRQFENRLLRSSEPFGPFALANTFAGVLALAFVLIASIGKASWTSEHRSGMPQLFLLVLLAATGWCLVLTKSRTAWFGVCVGLFVLAAAGNRGTLQGLRWRRNVTAILLIGVAAVAVLLVGFATGAIDREVLLESPRSLRFRVFYWIGAAGVIAESPFFGSGPGNFRQLYVRHKVADSSESILDPHNVVLDAWCFAGVIGLAGLVCIVGSLILSMNSRQHTTETDGQGYSVFPPLMICLAIHFGWFWLSGGILTEQEGMLAAAVLLASVAGFVFNRLPIEPAAPAAAAVSLLIHLLGAGGLQISVMGLLTVVLISAACVPLSPARSTTNPLATAHSRWQQLSGALITGFLAFAVLQWGIRPVRSSGIELELGRQRLSTGDTSGALKAFRTAADEDLLNPEPRQQIVNTVAYQLMQTPVQHNGHQEDIRPEQIQMACEACNDLIAADRRQVHGVLQKSRIHNRLFQLTNQQRYADSSLEAMRLGGRWHPTSPQIQLEHAILENTIGSHSRAVQAAQAALRIHAVNVSWGHTDQYLDPTELQAAYDIVNGQEQ